VQFACRSEIVRREGIVLLPQAPDPRPPGRQTILKYQEKTMNDMADPQIIQKVNALIQKNDEALNKNDAAAYAAIYAEDAVFVTDVGPVYGRKAIEKWFADAFQHWHYKNCLSKPDQNCPHTIGTAGNEAWTHGDWTQTLQEQNGDSIQVGGYWGAVAVREGDEWRFQMLTWNITPAPAVPSWRPE
jgi:uncharacterized protein (TIGR02246 family)